MAEVIGVRFKDVGKVYYFDPDNTTLQEGDAVIVETARGVECGRVATANREIPDEDIVHPLKKLIRKATQEDLAREKKTEKRKKKRLAFVKRKFSPISWI